MLYIKKLRGEQPIPVQFPKGISLRMIQNAWKKQGNNWIPVAETSCTPIFLAARMIVLRRWRIIWFVLHTSDAPDDACIVRSYKAVKPQAKKR